MVDFRFAVTASGWASNVPLLGLARRPKLAVHVHATSIGRNGSEARIHVQSVEREKFDAPTRILNVPTAPSTTDPVLIQRQGGPSDEAVTPRAIKDILQTILSLLRLNSLIIPHRYMTQCRLRTTYRGLTTATNQLTRTPLHRQSENLSTSILSTSILFQLMLSCIRRQRWLNMRKAH